MPQTREDSSTKPGHLDVEDGKNCTKHSTDDANQHGRSKHYYIHWDRAAQLYNTLQPHQRYSQSNTCIHWILFLSVPSGTSYLYLFCRRYAVPAVFVVTCCHNRGTLCIWEVRTVTKYIKFLYTANVFLSLKCNKTRLRLKRCPMQTSLMAHTTFLLDLPLRCRPSSSTPLTFLASRSRRL